MRAEKVSNGQIGRRLLNVEEASDYLGIEIDTVYKKSRLREIPSVKVGRALRFDIEALNRFINENAIDTLKGDAMYVDPQTERQAVRGSLEGRRT